MTPFGVPGVTFGSFPLAFLQAMGASWPGDVGVAPAPAPRQRATPSSGSRGAIEPLGAVTIHQPGSPRETKRHVSGAGEDKKAFFDAFAEYELGRREAQLLGAQLDLDRKADGAKEKVERAKLEVDTFSRQLTHVRASWGTLLSLGEDEAEIAALTIEQHELFFHLVPKDGKTRVPLRVGSGLFQRAGTRCDFPLGSGSGASLTTARPIRRRPFRASGRAPRAGYDSKKMLYEYAILSSPGRRHLEQTLAAAERRPDAKSQRVAEDGRSRLERLDYERECVRVGEGWFVLPGGGWVRAQVVGIAFYPCEEASDAQLLIQVGSRGSIRWQNGECQVERPPSCCTIL